MVDTVFGIKVRMSGQVLIGIGR